MSFTILLFCICLLVCVFSGYSILYALTIGLFIFLVYGKSKGFSAKELAVMCLDGIRTARNILITFILIGILTALWRNAGTIPAIICYAASLFQPSLFLLMAFLLNCAVSFLTGTAFGTAATMGVICTTMAAAMNIPILLVGGAVLSGVFFGDRCSPVSTSALLVAELTKTDIFSNIRRMFRTAVIPFTMTCLLYLIIGIFTSHEDTTIDLYQLFGQEFQLSPIALIPAAVILFLAAARVNVRLTMLASILTAIPVCCFLQGASPSQLINVSVFGYHSQRAAVAAMINGGGITSMLRVTAIVCLSSAYSGIFKKTGLLNQLQESIQRLSRRITAYGATLLASMLAAAVACNQTLAVMLTDQLCESTNPDSENFAIDLEDSAVVVAALIPWSIAGGAPLSSAGAPLSSIFFAFFLYLLPLWRLSLALFRKH